jgi:hypothetical protein
MFKSAWRMILIANEFAERQVYRLINPEKLFFVFGLFALGFKWENFAYVVPTMTTNPDSSIP